MFFMRNNKWLETRLIQIKENHFPDITEGNDIIILFGRSAKTRLGSIAIREKKSIKKPLTSFRLRRLGMNDVVSVITINGHFQNELIPECVIDGVLAHEFCHYVHGFNSLLTKKYSYPHAGGIIDHELKKRGMGDIIKEQKRWVRKEWRGFLGIK